MHKQNIRKTVLVNLLILIGSLTSIEIFSFLILQLNVMYKGKTEEMNYVRDFDFEFHPSVSHAHSLKGFKKNLNTLNSSSNNNLFTQKLYGDSKNKKIEIVILGGSTSDPIGTHFSGVNGTWPDQLGSFLDKSDNHQYEIINAAVGGATSSQELLRLILLLQQREPNIVLSFNGINEYYFMHINGFKKYKDLNNIYASKMTLEALSNNKIKYEGGWFCKNLCIQNNTIKLATKIKHKLDGARHRLNKSYNTVTSLDIENRHKKITLKIIERELKYAEKAAKIWKNNVMAMHAITKNKNIDYLVFLQPTYGLDVNIESFIKNKKEETTIQANPIDKSMTLHYLLRLNSLYSHLRVHCKQLDFCVDISTDKSLNSPLSIFHDARHHNRLGNNKIAIVLAKYLRNKDLIK